MIKLLGRHLITQVSTKSWNHAVLVDLALLYEVRFLGFLPILIF